MPDLPATGDSSGDWHADLANFWKNTGVDIQPVREPANTTTTQTRSVILATDLLDSKVVFDPNTDLSGMEVEDEISIDNVVVDINLVRFASSF